MKLDILVIAAHPGDAEASCGGTLLRMAAQGYRTGVLDLTSGESGWYPAAEARLDEARIAGERLGLAWRDNQRLPEGRLENTLPARMTVAVRIRELQPRVVILPFGEEGDPDRVHGRELGAEACFLAGVAALEEYSAPHRPERILYASLFVDDRPSFVVDVSAHFEARIEALRSYSEGSGDAALDRMETLARFYGSRIGVRYAEPFVLKETLAVRDIVAM